jgi:hypothetical protein
MGEGEEFLQNCSQPGEKRPLVIHMSRRGGNIKMYLTDIGCEFEDWVHLAHARY